MSKIKIEALQKIGVDEHEDRFGRKLFRPQNKTAHLVPVIIREYFNEEVDTETGESTFTRMYECEPAPGKSETRHFLAETYDLTFCPKHSIKPITRKLYGTQSNYRTKRK